MIINGRVTVRPSAEWHERIRLERYREIERSCRQWLDDHDRKERERRLLLVRRLLTAVLWLAAGIGIGLNIDRLIGMW